MRLLISAIVILLSITSYADKHLFILSGQSNMAGLDPNISFTPAVHKAFGKDNTIVVKSAQGGQPIRRWVKNWEDPKGTKYEDTGTLYKVLLDEINKATKDQKIGTVTFLWMQGENDAKNSFGEVYEKSFETLLNQLKTDLNITEINFVIGRLSDFGNDNKTYPHWNMIREIQVNLATKLKNGAWVDTDDLNNKGKKNDLHYTKDGYKIFGERLAEKSIQLINGKK